MKIVFLLFILVFLTYPAFAESPSITTDKEFYYTGDTITITVNRGITVEILDPDYSLIMINQGGGLTAVIGGPLWEKSGEYTAIVRDGSDTGQTTFFVNVEKIKLDDSDRITITNQKIANAFGDNISVINSESQVQITADITNNQNFEQEFAYVITIKEGDTISEPMWITGSLAGGQELNPSISWVPKYGGLHTITIQIWNNVIDRVQIAQDVVLEINVIGDKSPSIDNIDVNSRLQKELSQAVKESLQIYPEYFPNSLIMYLIETGLLDN